MEYTTIPPEKIRSVSGETYISYLSEKLGASREEILDVIKRSGISARRIAEYLMQKSGSINAPDRL